MIGYVGAFIALVIAGGLMFQLMARYLYNYRVTDDEIQIVLFGRIPLRRIPVRDIVEVRRVANTAINPISNPEVFYSERWGNRIWGNTVFIQKARGLSRRLLITPDDPDEFIRQVSRHRPGV